MLKDGLNDRKTWNIWTVGLIPAVGALVPCSWLGMDHLANLGCIADTFSV